MKEVCCSGERAMARSIVGPRHEIPSDSARYPAAFRVLPKPPAMLYVVGDPSVLEEGLAIVGARNATPYGRSAARLFAECAAREGIVVISGGARGCDSYAHEAALDAGGRTVAFLGGGCDKPYPASNTGLFNRIVSSGGAVVSEHPWDFPPKPYTFRARNRLIAGLARATLVVEAGVPSGTFSTADEALAANRDVLAVPGSIFSPTSRGANALIAQGAMPVSDEEGFREMLSRLFPESPGVRGGAQQLSIDAAVPGIFSAGEDALVAALRADPMRLEQMAEAFVGTEGSGSPFASVGSLMGFVGRLEAFGIIERFPDGRFGCVKGA